MNEYNYNNNGDGFNNDYREFCADNGEQQKKPRKHTGLKAAAFVMAMALVSAGSIGIYREVSEMTGSKDKSTALVSEDYDTDEDNTASSLMAKAMKMIDTEEVGGKALSNEDIVDKVLPSVVGIESTFSSSSYGGNNGFFGFGFNFGGSAPSAQTFSCTGTGVIITENGYIVTNAHVIYDSEYGGEKAESVSVLLCDERTCDAEIIGYDRDCDLAVLKIDEKGLTAAEFGNSDQLRLGESVIAIGNPLGFELMDTVTGGMISGLNRNITINDKAMTLIQTDAAINSGNSGGPLINKYGQVIGINSSKMSAYSLSEASIEGIGFAIPSNEANKIIDDIMAFGYVTGKPQLGISCQDVTETIAKMYNMPVGVYITAVTDGSAADKAGLRSGDIIIAVEGEKTETSEELTNVKNKYSAGDRIEITFMRSGEEHTVKLTLDEVKTD